jgi:hypothetical protein
MQAELEEGEDSIFLHPKLKNFKQRKREIQCALNLVNKLQPFIDR